VLHALAERDERLAATWLDTIDRAPAELAEALAERRTLVLRPDDDFPVHFATTDSAVLASVQRNPAWEAAQLNADKTRALASQQQNMMRQRQISQTLCETIDIVSSGYWSRQQIHEQHEAGRQATAGASRGDRAQAWSDAMPGWEDRGDDEGSRFSVEAGHERVWRDNEGNLISGTAPTNPEPTGHELRKPVD
jgi:hypothetical protein